MKHDGSLTDLLSFCGKNRPWWISYIKLGGVFRWFINVVKWTVRSVPIPGILRCMCFILCPDFVCFYRQVLISLLPLCCFCPVSRDFLFLFFFFACWKTSCFFCAFYWFCFLLLLGPVVHILLCGSVLKSRLDVFLALAQIITSSNTVLQRFRLPRIKSNRWKNSFVPTAILWV